jgi:hypothetical protein
MCDKEGMIDSRAEQTTYASEVPKTQSFYIIGNAVNSSEEKSNVLSGLENLIITNSSENKNLV